MIKETFSYFEILLGTLEGYFGTESPHWLDKISTKIVSSDP